MRRYRRLDLDTLDRRAGTAGQFIRQQLVEQAQAAV